MSGYNSKLVKVGIYIDGNYFSNVSDYYKYIHFKKSRINIKGLFDYIIHYISQKENIDPHYCRIVDAHYFRGKFNADETRSVNKLYSERQFEDILIHSGITTHYLPMTKNGEKGIDVWFALEAYEGAVRKNYDVIVLLAGDRDYVPLVRKLNTLGTRVMVLGWDFQYTGVDGDTHSTYTSSNLLQEVTYGLHMEKEITVGLGNKDDVIFDLFLEKKAKYNAKFDNRSFFGIVTSLKDGFGFITPEDGSDNQFFHYEGVHDDFDFNDFQVNDRVSFEVGKYNNKECAVNVCIVRN